jgi:hypothetical protein
MVIVNGKEAPNELQLTRRGSAFGVSPSCHDRDDTPP